MKTVQSAWCRQIVVVAALSCSPFGVASGADTEVEAVSLHLHQNSVVARHPDRAYLLSVAKAGEHLVAVGERGIVILSDDNGVSWKQVQAPAEVTLTAVKFGTERDGWAIGHMGIVLHTTDGGLTWTRQLDGVQASDLAVATAQAEADAASPDDKMVKRNLRIAHQYVEDGPVKPFTDLIAYDAQSAMVVGAYNLVYTTVDGGKSWHFLSDAIDNPRQYHIYGAVKTANGTLFAGEQGLILASAPGSTVSDMKMNRLKSPYDGSFFGALQIHADSVVIYGMRGKIYVTDDAGQSWRGVKIPGDVSINCAGQLNDGVIVLGDRSGRLLASNDQGVSFHVVPNTGVAGINGVAEAEDGGLILATDAGIARLPRSVVSQAFSEGSSK